MAQLSFLTGTPNTDPKGNKTDQGVYFPSLPPPSQWTLLHPGLSAPALHRVPWGHALSQGTGAGPLSPARECLVCLDHFFICRWTLRPVLKGKLQIALHTSLSFP